MSIGQKRDQQQLHGSALADDRCRYLVEEPFSWILELLRVEVIGHSSDHLESIRYNSKLREAD